MSIFTTASLATYATTLAGDVASAPDATAYSQQGIGLGSAAIPSVTISPGGQPTAYTDSSGWVAYALDSLAPLHQAVAAMARTAAAFNAGTVPTYGGGSVTLAEAGWGWSRADVLANLFGTVTGPNGFTGVTDFANLQAGDLVATTLGIYTDPAAANPAGTPGLVAPADTGHTMIVVDAPHLVPSAIGLDGTHQQSSAVVAVYAVSVVDSSTLQHFTDVPGFTTPLADSRDYHQPGSAVPAGLAAQQGGLGTGTIWFGVDASGQAVQFRFSAAGDWQPEAGGATTAAATIRAARLVSAITLSPDMLVNGKLPVQVYPNATATLNGVSYAMAEVLTGQGGLAVSGGGTLTLGSGNSFVGDVDVRGAGTTLALPTDDALGADANGLSLGNGTVLSLAAVPGFGHAITLTGSAALTVTGTTDLTGGVTGSGVPADTLHLRGGGALTLDGQISGLGRILVEGGTTLTLAGHAPAAVQLNTGATLGIGADTALGTLSVSGQATATLQPGTTLTLTQGLQPTSGAATYATLTLGGTGTLVLQTPGSGSTTVTGGHSVFVGTLAQLDGQALAGFVPGDVIDITDLAAVHGAGYSGTGVTTAYDAVSGNLVISQDGSTATVQLGSGLPPSGAFTVQTNGAGGTVLGLAAAPPVPRITAFSFGLAPGAVLHAGDAVTLTATASTSLIVTPGPANALPAVKLSDGGTATFDPASSSGATLVFRGVVGAADGTANLSVTGYAANGATIANAAGVTVAMSAALVGTPGLSSGATVDTPAWRLFDAAYYLAQNPDVAADGVDPYQHYMQSGWHEGRSPSALFDTRYYLNQNPDVAASGVNPLLHFATYGWHEGRDPSVLFSTADYLRHNLDVSSAGTNPLEHYMDAGAAQGRTIFAGATDILALQAPLVDAAMIYAARPDVAAAGLDAATWFNEYGWREGANPNAGFDTAFYLRQNPDVAASGLNPLVHYETYGWHEGRDPSLLFSTTGYLAANPDVAASGVDPLLQYVQAGQAQGRSMILSGGVAAADPLVDASFYDPQLGASLIPTGAAAQQQAAASYDAHGWQQGLNPDAWFDTTYYLTHNPDVAAAHINPLTHFEQQGWQEGRDPSAAFSTQRYLAAAPDVQAAGIDPLAHYLQNGQAEGRAIFPA